MNYIRIFMRRKQSRKSTRHLIVSLLSLLLLAGCWSAAPAIEPTATPAASQANRVAGEPQVPVSLRIPEIELAVDVVPMQWRVAEVDGQRTTVWVLPNEGAGWHPNSAKLGDPGNVVISGHQLLGDAPFAAIALGDVTVDQEILLSDESGEVFTYRVTEVTDPLPIPTSFSEESVLAARFTSETETPTLTLISGWPDFSSTHRVVVIAERVDESQ